MKFGISQDKKFGTLTGAYSRVTKTEYTDGQLTMDADEAALLREFFGDDTIFRKQPGVRAGDEARKAFKLYPDGREVFPKLHYPKPGKNELRLYHSAESGFVVAESEVFFMFIKDREIWIGSMDEAEWRSDGRKRLIDDDNDSAYQHIVQESGVIKTTAVKARDVYQRDRRIALERMEYAGYKCEFDPEHRLFIADATRKPFLEAHHLIPMSLQGSFEAPLDTAHNVFCLCPHCHRAIHHAEKPLVRDIIDTLVDRRPEVVGRLDGGVDDLYNFYAVEEID